MPGLDDFLPLFPDEDEAAIRARWEAWANEGVTIDQVDQWTNTREGSFFWVATTPGIREAARIYDLMGTEVPASSFPTWAWESYLDDHGETIDIQRLASVPAEGVVTFSGAAGSEVPAGTVVSVEPPEPDADVPEFETTADATIAGGGTVDAPIRATTAGLIGNVPADAITRMVTPLLDDDDEPVTVTNEDPTTLGADTETDDALQTRILEAYDDGRSPGNVRDYKTWTRAYGGVGRVTVIPIWDGPGTVKVIAVGLDGEPLSPTFLEGLQAFLDPLPGLAAGEAPVGAQVTVVTATAVPIAVSGEIEPEPGYSLDGDAGTTAIRAAVERAISDYILSVLPGEEVVQRAVLAQIMSVPGVHDAGSVHLNGSPDNVPLDTDPAEVPVVGDLTALVQADV